MSVAFWSYLNSGTGCVAFLTVAGATAIQEHSVVLVSSAVAKPNVPLQCPISEEDASALLDMLGEQNDCASKTKDVRVQWHKDFR